MLRLAAEELSERHAQVAYFPAYEILCDDLRDYRSTPTIMTHSLAAGVAYVWERFCEALLTPTHGRCCPASPR